MAAPATSLDELLIGLPGEERVRPGLEDLAAGHESEGSLLIEIAQTRLREAGLRIPPIPAAVQEAELRLYSLLGQKHDDEAHYQYTLCWNAWVSSAALSKHKRGCRAKTKRNICRRI